MNGDWRGEWGDDVAGILHVLTNGHLSCVERVGSLLLSYYVEYVTRHGRVDEEGGVRFDLEELGRTLGLTEDELREALGAVGRIGGTVELRAVP